MLGVRIGAVLAARKRGYKLSARPSETEELQEMAGHVSHEGARDFDIKENTKERLVFTKYPFIEWGVGLAFLSAFAFCEYMIWIVNEELGNYTMLHNWT